MLRLRIDGIPAAERGSIPKRLKRRLEDGSGRRLVTVIGPAGTGKTTLLAWFASWLEEMRGAVSLWTSVAHGSSEGTLSVREAVALGLSMLATTGGATALYLFIDDADDLEGDPQMRDLQDALGVAPPPVHFVMSGVGEVPFGLSRMRLSGSILEVRREDLRLTRQEFLDMASRGHRADQRGLERLHDLVLGWPAGVRICMNLLESGVSAAEIAQRLSHPDWMIADFLMDEVVAYLGSETIGLMCAMSAFECFDAPMACFCTETGAACHRGLRELVDRGVLLAIPPSGPGAEPQYRYYPVFYPNVRALARSRVPHAQARTVAKRGIEWLEGHGREVDAVEAAVACELYQTAFGLLNRHLFTVLVNCRKQDLVAVLRRVVCTSQAERACQCLASAWVMFSEGNARRATIWLRRYDSVCDQGAFEASYKGTVQIYQTIRVGVDVFTGSYDDALARGRDLLGSIGGPQLFLRATAMHNMGEAYERTGRYDEALESFALARTTAAYSGRREVVVLCDCEITWLRFMQGKLDAASNVALRSINASLEDPAAPVSWSVGVLYDAMARIYLQWGELGRARSYLAKTEGLFSPDRNPDGYFEAQLTSARCLALEGRVEEALETLAGAYEMVTIEHIPRGVDLLVLVSYAECLVGTGRLDFAARVLGEIEERLDERDVFFRVHADLIWSQILLLLGALDDAEYLLRRSLEQSQLAGLGLLVTDSELRLACVLGEQGEGEEARALMASALTEASREQRVYPFRNMLPVQSALLREIAYPVNANRVVQDHERTARDYARRILEFFSAGKASEKPPRDTEGAGGTAALSERESEIWALLRQGKTRREIGAELGIKLNTVRTHVRNIYRKLGIHGRADL